MQGSNFTYDPIPSMPAGERNSYKLECSICGDITSCWLSQQKYIWCNRLKDLENRLIFRTPIIEHADYFCFLFPVYYHVLHDPSRLVCQGLLQEVPICNTLLLSAVDFGPRLPGEGLTGRLVVNHATNACSEAHKFSMIIATSCHAAYHCMAIINLLRQ